MNYSLFLSQIEFLLRILILRLLGGVVCDISSELECNLLCRDFLVYISNSIEFVFNEFSVILVQDDFGNGATIDSVSDSSADHVGREKQIFKDCIMNSGQSSAVRSLLGLVGFLPLRLNGSLCNNQDIGLEFGFKFRD